MTIVNTKDTEVDILNSVTKQSIPRDWQPVMVSEELSPLIITDSKIDFSFPNQLLNRWLSLIRKELYAIPSVEDIFVTIEGSDVDVWVVIPERDLAALDQLANIEWKLLELFVSGEQPVFLIDFHIIYRCGRNVEDLVPTGAFRLTR